MLLILFYKKKQHGLSFEELEISSLLNTQVQFDNENCFEPERNIIVKTGRE